RFGIPGDRVLAASVATDGDRISGDLVRVPTDAGKKSAIEEIVGKVPDAVFGNSIHDADMLQMARQAYAINPNPDLRNLAETNGWPFFQPVSLEISPALKMEDFWGRCQKYFGVLPRLVVGGPLINLRSFDGKTPPIPKVKLYGVNQWSVP